MTDYHAKAETLTEALPWIKRTWGRTVVIKYGGSAMTDPVLRAHVASDIVLKKLVGINPVIVHGGGPEITTYMNRLDMPVEFYDGLRVTTPEAMELVKMVLVGKVNKELVAEINTHGRLAVGIAGDDANLIRATQRSERLGRVGDVTEIDTTVVTKLVEDGFIPVIATVAVGDDGGSFNINADHVAGAIAAELDADKVIFLTDVDGLYEDFDDKHSLISALSIEQAEEMIVADTLVGGMVPKVAACV
ncbi:MAG: acetylglutamate kinase, partial [Actinomycetota bacterium]|nr:acetylglutamate kinase [Actinomycetota bacterium]